MGRELIKIVELESFQTCLERRFNALGTMIRVPEFRDHKYFLPLDLTCIEYLLHRFADLFLSPVTFRGVERPKSGLQRRFRRILGCDGIGNQRSKAEGGDRAGSMPEW